MEANNIKQAFIIKKVKKQTSWSKFEDQLLIKLVKQNIKPNWKLISSYFNNKSYIQCFSRYARINPALKRGAWSSSEDIKLTQLVSKYGKNWALISKKMGNRNNKQIRDRYVNILDPNLNKKPFTLEDDMKILELNSIYNNNWSKIASYFSGRTTDNIKIRYYTIKKRKKTTIKHQVNEKNQVFISMDDVCKEKINNLDEVQRQMLFLNKIDFFSKLNNMGIDELNLGEDNRLIRREESVHLFDIDDYFSYNVKNE